MKMFPDLGLPWTSSSSGSMVKHSTYNPVVKGVSPATAAGTGKRQLRGL
jgi:hypothetical protein